MALTPKKLKIDARFLTKVSYVITCRLLYENAKINLDGSPKYQIRAVIMKIQKSNSNKLLDQL
jgi:hypothetical protein